MFGRIGAFIRRARSFTGQDSWFSLLFGGGKTAAGPEVSEESAMGHGLFRRCLEVKADTLGSLPCKLYRVTSTDGVDMLEEAKGHPVHSVLALRPNDRQSPLEFFAQMSIDLDLWGNSYYLPEWQNNGRLRALWRVPPHCVEAFWTEYPHSHAYRYTPPKPDESKGSAEQRTLLPGDIIHIQGMPATQNRSDYGLRGVGLLETGRETIGLAIALRNFMSETVKNRAIPAGILKYHGSLSERQRQEARDDWDSMHGEGKRGKTAVLPVEVDYQALALNHVDAQIAEQNVLSDQRICTITGIPGVLVGVKSDTTYSNTSQQMRAFHAVTISQLATRVAKALEHQLISPSQRGRFEIRFALSDMLKGDDMMRAKWFETMVRIGAMSPNDVLAMDGRNPRPGGDVYTLMPGAGMQNQPGNGNGSGNSDSPPPSETETPNPDSDGGEADVV